MNRFRGAMAAGLLGGMLALGAAPLGCSLGADLKATIDDLGAGGMGGSGISIDVDVTAALKALFPSLSADEIAELSASLSVDEVLALREELEKARAEAEEFSDRLFTTAEEAAADREAALADQNDGFPEGLDAIGTACNYDATTQKATLNLAGVFSGKTEVHLSAGQVSVLVDGVQQEGTLSCLADGAPVDIVLLVDITGSMSNVIASVRDSVIRFVDSVEASGLKGTISVVTFQDTVGVNVTFQEPAPRLDYERSPFFKPVSLSDAAGVEELRGFVNRLEANQGADAPENLAGAVDFARNSTIGGTAANPGVIDGSGDPMGTSPFPALKSKRQVFIALTDVGFHPDAANSTNSSLLSPFEPRPAADILATLRQTGTVVHVVDPSWADTTTDPTESGSMTDADYWAIETGGLGEDVIDGYSLVDLEGVIVSDSSGLLDVYLDSILATSCSYEFSADLSAVAEVELQLEVSGEVSTRMVAVHSF